MSNNNEIITGSFTLPYYDGRIAVQTSKTGFAEYRLMVLDLRKKETPDHNRIIFSTVGKIEGRSSTVLKEAVILKHLNDLSKIENIGEMYIDVVRLNWWYI
jgi:hypothetical protein